MLPRGAFWDSILDASNAFAALGELTALRQTTCLDMGEENGKGVVEKDRDGKGTEVERNEGKGTEKREGDWNVGADLHGEEGEDWIGLSRV